MTDIFTKLVHGNVQAEEARRLGIYPYFHALESRQDTEVIMEGKRRIMLGSNNYLGLTTNPEVIEAGIKAIEKYGTGCSGSRFLNGTLELHLQLEDKLAKFLGKEGVVTFSTGFQSNLGIISAVVGRNDYASTTAASSATGPCCATATTTWRIWSGSSRRSRRSPGASSSPTASSPWAGILRTCRR